MGPPPVSEEHLRAWFDLYQRVYTGADDTELMAMRSAAACFPENPSLETGFAGCAGSKSEVGSY
jgi:hypothetical protein